MREPVRTGKRSAPLPRALMLIDDDDWSLKQGGFDGVQRRDAK